MSTSLNLGSTSQTAEKVLLPSEMEAISAAAASYPGSAAATVPANGKKLPFGFTLAPGRALHQSIISLADQAVSSATNFITGIIIARACTKEEMGLYMLGLSLIVMITDFQTSLITTPYMVYAPRLKGRAHALYTGSTLIHQLAFCLLAMFGVAGGALMVGRGFGPHGLGPVLGALSVVIALIMLREHARRVSFARLRLITAFLFDSSIAVGQIGGLILLGHFGLLSAIHAFWVIGAVCGIAVLGWLWSDRECYHPQLEESLADLKKNWVFGKWVFASGLVWAVSMNLYPWLLAYFHGTASAGVWAACLGVVSVGNPALMGVQNFAGPKIAHVYAESGQKALRPFALKITAALALFMSVLCLALIGWGGRLVALLYGHQYAGNNLIVIVLSLNLPIAAATFTFSRALMAIERADLDFQVNFAALFIMVFMGFWLVRSYGTLGAAVAFLVANFATSVAKAMVFLSLPAHRSAVAQRLAS